MFPVRVRLQPMCRGELPAVITRLMSKCLWSEWKWPWGTAEMFSPFPCSPVIREWLWKKTLIEQKCWLTQLLLRYGWFMNPAIWLAESIFIHGKLKIYKTIFYVSWIYICMPKIKLNSSILIWNKVDSKILKSDWLRVFLTSPN